MTSEERASRELAEELGFRVKRHDAGWGIESHRIAYGDRGPIESDASTFALWSLCVRQRVRLNEHSQNNNQQEAL